MLLIESCCPAQVVDIDCFSGYVRLYLSSDDDDDISFLLLASPSSPVGVDAGAARMNVCHCFLSLTHFTAWRILLPLFSVSSLIFSLHLCFGLPRVLVPVTVVSSTSAGNYTARQLAAAQCIVIGPVCGFVCLQRAGGLAR